MKNILITLAILLIGLISTTSCPNGNGSDNATSRSGSEKTGKEDPHVVIFTCESLKPAVEKAIEKFNEKSLVRVSVVCDSSKELTERVLSGSRCDIFIPDRAGALDRLIKEKKITEDNVKPLFLERLAVVIRRGDDAPAVLEGLNVIEFIRTADRIAIVDPESAFSFSGNPAMQAIKKLNPKVKEESIVRLPDVKAVFLYVKKGNVDAAVVFNSEYANRDDVSLVGYIPQDSFNPYPYPLIVLPDATSQTDIVVRFLTSDEADLLYNELGYQSSKAYASEPDEENTTNTKQQKST